jgi:hypothetical protein
MGTCTASLMSHFVTCLLISVVYIIALCSSINTTTFFSLYVRCCLVLDLTADKTLRCPADEDVLHPVDAPMQKHERSQIAWQTVSARVCQRPSVSQITVSKTGSQCKKNSQSTAFPSLSTKLSSPSFVAFPNSQAA